MKKTDERDAGRSKATANARMSAEADTPVFLPPFKPHRGIFYTLLAVMGIWVGILVTLYVTTVYPRHHAGHINREQSTPRSDTISR
jgi:hypothetical protein